MSVGQKLAMLKIRPTSVTFLRLRNLEAAPEEAMQLRRLIKSSNKSLEPYLERFQQTFLFENSIPKQFIHLFSSKNSQEASNARSKVAKKLALIETSGRGGGGGGGAVIVGTSAETSKIYAETTETVASKTGTSTRETVLSTTSE